MKNILFRAVIDLPDDYFIFFTYPLTNNTTKNNLVSSSGCVSAIRYLLNKYNISFLLKLFTK